MNRAKHSTEIKMVPIEKINILNPRVRNKKTFDVITDNIALVGLKKPITITACKSGAPGKDYDLVCGQGRLEAFLACGQTEIPAMIIDASEEQALIMSLVENLARRQHRALDLLQAVEAMQKQGYNLKQIAAKTGLAESYVIGVVKLMQQGEERLLTAVESGNIPLVVAIHIAETPDEDLQKVLQEAYDSKQLRGNRLIEARRLLEKRRDLGKGFVRGGTQIRGGNARISVQDVMKIYRKEVDRKRHLTRKAEKTSDLLIFVVAALRALLKEEHFNSILKAEKLNTIPKPISALITERER